MDQVNKHIPAPNSALQLGGELLAEFDGFLHGTRGFGTWDWSVCEG